MSLNGLDDPKVSEAYEAAAGEPGGWFLLKYASRDEVEVLGKGNGGVTEMRKAVADYDETNPLYGFVKYRRRNVLIKYLPEGCSRLIQARVAVHFNAVCEQFSPFDSQFDIATSDDLRDSKLSAACSLHAATGSNSSSGSLRRKHLMEIAEEDEEEHQQPAKRQSLIKDDDEPKKDVDDDPVTLNADLATSPENSKFSAPNTSEVPTFTGANDPPAADASRRLSSQSGRAEVFSSYSTYTYKPKVKLGPRPSLDTNTRPQTAGNFRPVSSIPAGFKLFGKGGSGGKKSSSGRKDSAGSASTAFTASPSSEITEISFAATATLPIPEESSTKMHIESARPATSSGVSTKSAMTTSSRATMTPEKARLKKAMQLREKKKKKAANNMPAVPAVPAITATDDNAGKTTEDKINGETVEVAAEAQRMPVVKADSGIAIDASPASTKGGDVASDRTQSDSRPASPVIASSEAEQSTKASSVSESTDHTVEAAESKAVDEEASSNGSTPKPTQGQDQSASPVDGPTAPQTNGTEAESDAEKTDDVSVSKQEEPTVTPAAFTTEQEAVAEDKVLEEQNEAVAVPVSDAATDIPVPATSAPVSEPEENKPETQEILETMHPPPTTDVSEAPSSQLPNTTAEEPSEQITLEERPQILPRATEADESDTETVLAPPKKQLSTRRKLVEPIRTDLAQQSRPTSQSEFNFSDNESLLEELQSATVEEAKPMTVSKTPLTPVFPGKLSAMGGPSSPNKPHVVRTVSNPVRGSTLVAPPTDVSQSSARSLSQGAAYLHQVTQQRNGDPNLAKRTNMGSGISQRIKALELLSANSAETASQPGSRPSSTFFSVKKDRVPSRSPSVVDRTNSFTRPSTAQSRDHSPETSKFHRDRSGSISSRLSMFEPTGSPSNTPRGRPETISVTAKIIRDSLSKSRNPSDQGPLELKQSPLLVDHQRATDTPEVVEPTGDTTERRTSMSHDRGDTSSRRSSFSIVRDFIKEGRKSLSSPSTDNLAAPNHSINNGARSPTRPPSTHQNSSSFAGRLSIGGSRRSFSKDRDVSSILSDDGADDSKSTSDKRMSRAGRLMRRLSSLSGSSRSKITSPTGGTPTVAEEILPDTTANLPSSSAGTTASSPSVAAYMGDVNVQFPDTLLWKRRNMYLDSQGFVVLSSLPQQSQSQRTTGIKRFHLGDFKTPYAPDVEVQELPNSVVLDLVEGSAVQVACEDRAGQMHVLQILRDAHAAYAGQ